MSFPFRWAAGRGLGLAFRDDAVYKAAKSSLQILSLKNCSTLKRPGALCGIFPAVKDLNRR